MLAKIWKKVLLAVCIIACIYNVMSKLVNRTSLEDNLNSANDGNTVFDIFQKEEQEKTKTVTSTNEAEIVTKNGEDENVEENEQETSNDNNINNSDENSEEFKYTEYVILN